MTPQPHPLRCETCTHLKKHDIHGNYCDISGRKSPQGTLFMERVAELGCASHSSRPATPEPDGKGHCDQYHISIDISVPQGMRRLGIERYIKNQIFVDGWGESFRTTYIHIDRFSFDTRTRPAPAPERVCCASCPCRSPDCEDECPSWKPQPPADALLKEIEVRNQQADDIGWLVLQMERLGYTVQIRGTWVAIRKQEAQQR